MEFINHNIIKLSEAELIVNRLQKSDLSALFKLNLEASPSSIEKFKKVCYETPIIISFNWKNWDEGKKAFEERSFSNHSNLFLFKMLTFIIRNDRVMGNFIYYCLREGIIQKIITEIENNFLSVKKNKS